MTIQTISKIGNIQLATPSLPVTEFSTPALKQLIKDMHDTMLDKKGVGIAAPQIGQNWRVIMFGFDHNDRYPHEKPVPFTVVVNPELEILADEIVEAWEGCLSVPGLRGFVPRYKKIRYSGFDPDGKPLSVVAEGFHARVVQHECDHINGLVYVYRLKDLKKFGFEDELREIIWPSAK